jgi:hypothetical protein
MAHRNYLRIALAVCLGLVAAGLHSSTAQEKDPPGLRVASAQARRDAARKVYEGTWERHVRDPETVPFDIGYFHDWSVRWLQAERDLGQTKAEQVAALEAHLKRMQFWKDLLDRGVKEGQTAAYEPRAAEFFCLEAEDWLAEAKALRK